MNRDNNSNYAVGHQRGAVKGVLPAQIREELSKNSISDFPASGNDEQKMYWVLDSTGLVFQNVCSESVTREVVEILGQGDTMPEDLSELTLEGLDKYMMGLTGKEMNYMRSLGQPTERIVGKLEHYNPDFLRDYLCCHGEYACHRTHDNSKTECVSLTTLVGLTCSVGIVAPASTMTAMHTEDCYLCSINVHMAGGIKIWIIIDSDPGNFRRFRQMMQEHLMKCSNMIQKKRCIIRLPFLVNNNIRFGIIFQNQGSLVLSNPCGAHEIVNMEPNITYARNLALRQNIDVFTSDPDAFDCKCKRAHYEKGTAPLRKIMKQLFIANWWSRVMNTEYESRQIIKNKEVKKINHGREGGMGKTGRLVVKVTLGPSGFQSKLKYPCEKCTKTFTRTRSLQEHVKIVHLGERRTFLCNECNKSFDRKRNLDVHMKSHEQFLDVCCAYCGQLCSKMSRVGHPICIDFTRGGPIKLSSNCLSA